MMLLVPLLLLLVTATYSYISSINNRSAFKPSFILYSSNGIKDQLTADMKVAMKSKDKVKLNIIRSIINAIKQVEIDDQVTIDDDGAIAIMSKLLKQRKESMKSYQEGGRKDLADAEEAEYNVIKGYMPAQMSSDEINKVIVDAIAKVSATTIKDMGKVMAEIRPVLLGKADMSEVGPMVKSILSK